MIPYKEKKEAIESLLSKNINPSLEALQYYFPTLIGQCQAQNALSDLINVADYLRHKYVSRNADVKLVEFQTPVRKQVRLVSRKKAAKIAAPSSNDNCNDAMSESTFISSTQETDKSLPQQEFEETMGAQQALSFRFQSSTPQKPIPCTQKADAKGFEKVKHIVNSMMERGEWPNYPTFCKLYPDLGQRFQKQSLTNTISRLRLLFDSNDEKECHEEDSASESQELQNEGLDEESTGEATEDSEGSQECEWNEDTFIHRQIACTEQSDPKGYRKIRNIVLDLLQNKETPSYPLFVERYPGIVAKYRERSLMSAITKIVAEEGKKFLPETSDSENEDEDRDEDTVIMDVSDFGQDDEMNVVEANDNKIYNSRQS
ncbi:predicted protein [Chaetoceros tenuissimus]|uniref:Uncharacterized protein n=1 Tax=Chaetoceros tenuissimus TaxID=426638 RepID=A0AAD3D0D7_9STRA|nr:predicted protein [Chaetoceros tenuissimus]